MIRKKAANSTLPTSLGQALKNVGDDPFEVSATFAAPTPNLKRVKPDRHTPALQSGFAAVDASKLDLGFLKAKINQVLKSFANKKSEQTMQQRPAKTDSHNQNTSNQANSFKSNDKLDRYIARAYKKCLNAKEQAYMSSLLDQVIQDAQKTGEAASRNWDLTPLPLLPRDKQDNLNLVLNSQFLQINKNANSTLLSALARPEVKPKSPEPKIGLLNALLQPPPSAPSNPKELLNSLGLGKLSLTDKQAPQKIEPSRFQNNLSKPTFQQPGQPLLATKFGENSKVNHSALHPKMPNFELAERQIQRIDQLNQNTRKATEKGKKTEAFYISKQPVGNNSNHRERVRSSYNSKLTSG